MKRPRTRIKELEETQAALARLRRQRTEIGAEILRLEAAQEAQVVQAVIDQVKTLGIARLPIGDILAHLANLGENFQQAPQTSETADASVEADEANIEAFVRLSRNASSANRHALERAGLHWNGRAAGWTGHVTAAGLERLRSVFGKRVEKPDLADPGETLADSYQDDADDADDASAVEDIATPSAAAGEQGTPTEPDPPGQLDSAAATMALRASPLRGLLPRRSTT
jgi:hypothetical protein